MVAHLARTRWPARSCADLACPFAPLGRSAKHVAVASATAYNMMECIAELDSSYNIAWENVLAQVEDLSDAVAKVDQEKKVKKVQSDQQDLKEPQVIKVQLVYKEPLEK